MLDRVLSSDRYLSLDAKRGPLLDAMPTHRVIC